jgi:hypothetical protein
MRIEFIDFPVKDCRASHNPGAMAKKERKQRADASKNRTGSELPGGMKGHAIGSAAGGSQSWEAGAPANPPGGKPKRLDGERFPRLDRTGHETAAIGSLITVVRILPRSMARGVSTRRA